MAYPTLSFLSCMLVAASQVGNIMEMVKQWLPVIEKIHGSLWRSKHHMISAFATSFFKKKLPTDVFTGRISASVALAVQLQALAIPPNKMPFAAVEEKPTFVTVLKNIQLVWETLCKDFMAA